MEDLFDDSRQQSMHDEPRLSKYVAHIPFFMLNENKNRKLRAENVFFSLAEMGSLSFPSLDTTKSIVISTFKNSEQKILGGGSKVYNYDSLLKE